MKSNWQTRKLEDVCEIFTDGDWIEKKDQSDSGIRLIQTGNIGIGNFLNKESRARYISEKTFDQLKCTEVLPGDILLSRLPEPVGRACLVPDFGSKLITAVDCTIIRVDSKKVSSEYLVYYSQSSDFLRKVNLKSTGTTRTRISRKNLGQIQIPIPPLAEQKRIVKILDKTFVAIDKAKANTEKNLANARELFESYSRVAFENPGNWNNKELGDVCNLYQGIAINAKTRHALVEKSDLPLLRIKDLKNNTFEQYIDPDNFPKNALVNESDLIYTRTGQIGLVFTGRKGVLHNNSFKVVPDNILRKEYLFHWLQNPTFKSKIISLASRAAQPDITHKLFKQQSISIPSLPEQKSIVAKLNTISTRTKKLEKIYEQKLANLEELRKSILKKAFTGEL